ncbi:MAG: hypothetical protein IKK29_05125, partial [Christensenellaceae bacterium]|nr:hypothetical protein [Christensenellaceae bacterium]
MLKERQGYSAFSDFSNTHVLPKNRSYSRFRSPLCFAFRLLQRTASLSAFRRLFTKEKSTCSGANEILLKERQGYSALLDFSTAPSGYRKIFAARDFTVIKGCRAFDAVSTNGCAVRIPSSFHQRKITIRSYGDFSLAARQGFEPWRRFHAYTMSSRAPSTNS